MPTDVLYYMLALFELDSVVPLCLSSRTFAHLMRDERFRVPIVRKINVRKFERESKLLEGVKEAVRANMQSEFNCTFERLHEVVQALPEQHRSPFESTLSALKGIMEKKAVMEEA